MRTHTILTTLAAVTLVMLSTLCIHPAGAQPPNPLEPIHALPGLQHEPTSTGSSKLHTTTIEHDMRIDENRLRPGAGNKIGTSYRSNDAGTATAPGFSTNRAQPGAALRPPDPVLGLQYNMTNADGVKLHGAAVDYDMPIYGDLVRLAAGGAFGTSNVIDELFAGAGPGVRHDTGEFQVYAHALFGYRRIGGLLGQTGGFDGRFVGGLDYPLGPARNFRAGVAYGGDVHVTAGMSFSF